MRLLGKMYSLQVHRHSEAVCGVSTACKLSQAWMQGQTTSPEAIIVPATRPFRMQS